MPRTKIVKTAGAEIVSTDLTNMTTEDEVLEIIDDLQQIIAEREEPFCTLYDVSGTYATNATIARGREYSKFVDSTGLSLGAAVVGVNSRSKRIIGNFLKPNLYFAKDMADALAHLTDKIKKHKT